MNPRPLVVRELSSPPGVIGAFAALRRLPYPLLLDSATAVTSVARYSFAMADPRLVIRAKGRRIEIHDRRFGTIVRHEGRALDVVAELLYGELREASSNDELPPFRGGAAGYIGYEYGEVLETLPRPATDDLVIPDVVMGLYDWVVAWDHLTGRAWLLGEDPRAIDAIAARLEEIPRSTPPECVLGNEGTTSPLAAGPWSSTFTAETYVTAVERVRAYIRQGEIFQANLSQRFCVPLGDGSVAAPWTLYRRLRSLNPAPFASYFDFGDAVIVSISPERFLFVDANGTVETRPIKGTRPRATSEAQDTAYQDELLQSGKDAAEHVMIVDVLRNDLSRVCTYGSVTVPSLMAHERHPTVHHLVSTITGQLRSTATPIDLLHACFPGGSITGAPKIRAMEIIAELEPVTRGPYCGTIGYLSTSGAMDSSIAIRTCVITHGQAYFSAGGGIVADSEPTEEYAETLVKAQALLQALTTTIL
ncbi:MAG TPA: aminodeoxychorismate synthase component I [Gemmatimonadaceae bacterium]|jgi:para-aminobenzoate synthetase component 1|nr:aminodeoxychorismate synthase component I [Gemmatimonadaceae bacterium]